MNININDFRQSLYDVLARYNVIMGSDIVEGTLGTDYNFVVYDSDDNKHVLVESSRYLSTSDFPGEKGFIDAAIKQREKERKSTSINQVVVCAAIRSSEGYIICGVRHYDYLMRDQLANSLQDWKGPIEQGFVDQRGNFLTREEASSLLRAEGRLSSVAAGVKANYLVKIYTDQEDL